MAMTEPPPSATSRRAAAEPRAAAVLWAAAALFLVLLAVLAMRVSAGQDPALRAQAASAPLPARRLLIRKLYERRVIVHLPASAPPQPTQASQQVSPGGAYPSVPMTRTS
jgi:hypothetical protein